jgi:hypothetical protein
MKRAPCIFSFLVVSVLFRVADLPMQIQAMTLSCPPDNVIYIAPNGKDTNSGGKNCPKQTLKAAVRSAIQIQCVTQKAGVIVVRQGVYYQDEPLILDARASGISIIAEKGATPVISGGRCLLGLKWAAYKGPIMVTSVKGKPFDQLFVNGVGQIRARYPNYQADKRLQGNVDLDEIQKRSKTWSDPATGFLHSIAYAGWGDVHRAILGRNTDQTLKLGAPIGNNRASWGGYDSEVRVDNIFEELDAPGEWFYDVKKSLLYYYPLKDTDIQKAKFEVSGLKNVIKITGTEKNPVHHIDIEGLMFTQTQYTFMETIETLLRDDWLIARNGAILIEGTRDIYLHRNKFYNLGGNAVFASGFNRKIVVETNEMSNIGASAVAFCGKKDAVRWTKGLNTKPITDPYQPLSTPGVGRGPRGTLIDLTNIDSIPGPKTDDYPSDCTVYDNLIHDIGLIEKQSAGVEISIASRIKVSHNSIYDCPRAGINIGNGNWGGHDIQSNDIFNTVLETSDHGSINAWGRDRFWTYPVTDNPNAKKQHSLDAVETTQIRGNRVRCDHGWDIDLDDGTSNTRVENNLMLRGGLKVWEWYGGVATNNIFLNNTLEMISWPADGDEVFTRNIVMGTYKTDNPIQGLTAWVGQLMDKNLFVRESDRLASQNVADKKNWELHSIVGDPKFVNPAKGDFRLKSDSPALLIGFKSFSTDCYGVMDPALKKKAETPKIPKLILEPVRRSQTGS